MIHTLAKTYLFVGKRDAVDVVDNYISNGVDNVLSGGIMRLL